MPENKIQEPGVILAMSRMKHSLFFIFSNLFSMLWAQFGLADTVFMPRCLLIKVDGELSCWGNESIRGVIAGQKLSIQGVRPKTDLPTTFYLKLVVGSQSSVVREIKVGQEFSLSELGNKFQIKAELGDKNSLEIPVVKVVPKLQYIVVKSGNSKVVIRSGEIADIQEVMPFEVLEIKATVSGGLKVKTSPVTPMLDQFSVLYKGQSIGSVYFAKKVRL